MERLDMVKYQHGVLVRWFEFSLAKYAYLKKYIYIYNV